MSERLDTNQTTPESAATHATGVHATLRKRVRERSFPLPSCNTAGSTLPRPAHPSNRLIAELSNTWRVVDDPLQWILQQKQGNPRKKTLGWQGVSFCRTREALLRCATGCEQIDGDAHAKLEALPDWHRDWDLTNLDVPETGPAQADKQPKPLAANASEVSDAAQ